MSTYEISLKKPESILVAGRHFILKENKGVILEDLSFAFKEAFDYINAHSGKMTSACMAIWYTPFSQRVNEEVEAAFPLRSFRGNN